MLLGLALSLGAGVVVADTLRVPSEYGTINAALDASAFGDTVLVAPGTYTEAEVRAVGPWTIASIAFLRDGVTLRSESGPDVTVLDLQGDDFGAQAALVVVAFELPSAITRFEGFTVTGAPVGNSGTWISDCGTLTIRDCVFLDIDNTGNQGGGVRCLFTKLVITGCRFENCHGSTGGGMSIHGFTFEMDSCEFVGCSNVGLRFDGDPLYPGHRATIRNTTFIGNYSVGGGGGLAGAMMSPVLVERCTFIENVAMTLSAAALHVDAASFEVKDNVFLRNHARAFAVTVGGSVNGGLFEGNTFHGNSHEEELGGATVCFQGGSFEFRNNIVSGTTGGSALWLFSGTMTNGCNAFWDNPDGHVEGFALDPTDRIVDPLFCNPEAGDLTLHADSPCLPENSLGCGLIGALEVGCGTIAVEPESWARIKERYRK